MTPASVFKEELELDELRQTEQQLLQRQKECAELPRKLAQEKKDRDCTMPPLSYIGERRRLNRHEESVSRGEVTNVQRVQRRSLTLLFMLTTATATLIWWSLKLMQG